MPDDTDETLKRILIIDDDQAVTNYLMAVIMQTGRYEPIVINESRMFSHLLTKAAIDLILLDKDLPDMDGIAILSSLHEKKFDSPVIVLTGVNDVDLAVKAMKLGVFDYLIKPVDDEKLIEVIDAAMGKSAVT